jgi:hypothetical protein
MNTQLPDLTKHDRYQFMLVAIRDCHAVDEVKQMRDQARALEEYMKQAQNQEAERKACEIRIRAERRVGEILRDMQKAKGVQMDGRDETGSFRRSHDATTEKPKTLSDLGINKTQSSRYQALADIPADHFESLLADPEAKPSTVGLINLLLSKHQHMLMRLSSLPSLKLWPRDMNAPHQNGAFLGEVLVTLHLFPTSGTFRPLGTFPGV